MPARYAKILLSLALASFALLVTFNNLTDYASNLAFVSHVLSMDSTFADNTARYRAITTPALWHAAYWLIILAEGLTGAMLAYGALSLWRQRKAEAAGFARAKKWVIGGASLGFMVWFFGFMVIGGEWFLMWQSRIWNGQEAAFRFYMAVLGVLIFVNQAEHEAD